MLPIPNRIHRAVLEKLRLKKKKKRKNFNFKYFLNFLTNHFTQKTRPRTIQNLSVQQIWKLLSQVYSRNRLIYKTPFFHFSIFTFLLITKER